jgi:hypothetical protein
MPKKITLDEIKSKITNAEYMFPDSCKRMTIAVVTMENGFAISGQACATNIEDFSKEMGQKVALDDAIKRLWGALTYCSFEESN